MFRLSTQNMLIVGGLFVLWRMKRHGGGLFGNDKPFGVTPSQVNGEGYP